MSNGTNGTNGNIAVPDFGAKSNRGVVWEGKPGSMSVRPLPFPRIQAAEDALVRITSSAICGTDLHTYHGVLSSPEVPFSVGHEGMGIVVAVGSAVDSIKVGDRVVISCVATDRPVVTHSEISNSSFQGFGLGEAFGGLDGLQSEHVRVAFADSTLIKVPHTLPDKEWLFIGDIFGTAWSGLDWAGFKPGDSVAVFGAGPLGILCAYSAVVRGASTVYVVDHVTSRLAKAASIGPGVIPIDFTVKGKKASEQILAQQPGGVDRAVDCVGEECVNDRLEPQQDYVLCEASAVTSVGGGIGVPGVYWAGPNTEGAPNADKIKAEMKFPISSFWSKSQTFHAGVIDPSTVAKALIALIESGRARPGFIVDAEFDLDDAPKAYKLFDAKKVQKVVFRGAH